jgi:putative two-component system response regulator
MKQHTIIGANILDNLAIDAPDASFLSMASGVARFHHERFDGRGYPAGLYGTEIPLPARIVALADAFDAITSNRPYKASQPATIARDLIQQDSGSHFDPIVVAAFLRRFDALVNVQKQIQNYASVVIGANSLLPEQLAAATVSF